MVFLLYALLLFSHSIVGANIPFASHLCKQSNSRQHAELLMFLFLSAITFHILAIMLMFLFLSAIIFHTACWCSCFSQQSHCTHHADVPVFYQQSYCTHHAGVSVSCWPFCFFPAPIPSVVQWYISLSLYLLYNKPPFCLSLLRGEGLLLFLQPQKDLTNFTYTKYLIDQINF